MATQSSAFSLSSSFQFLKPRSTPIRLSTLTFDPASTSISSTWSSKYQLNLACANGDLRSLGSSFLRHSSISPIFKPSLIAGRCLEHDFSVRASASAPESAEENTESGSTAKILQLGLLFALWYLFNIYYNIYNKQVLKVYPYPVTLTVVQLVVGTSIVLFMWAFKLHKRPNISGAQLGAILPLAVMHTCGNLFTNMSLGKVAVSFTHTIKALEPFFTVVLSALFLGKLPSLWVIFSLMPIVGGVVLASLTEVSFNWAGFWCAMASNLANQSRNVLSKQVMGEDEGSLDNINLFSIITILSLVVMAPLAYLGEGGMKFTPAFMEAAGLNVKEVFARTLLASICFHAYQQIAYMILEKVSPVSHSVGNCVKRVVVIVSSVIFFRTPVSSVNALGTGIALAGVFLYSQLARIKAKAA